MEPFPANRVSKRRSAIKKRERSRSHSMRKLFLAAASVSALTCAVAFAQTTPTPSTSSAPSAKMDQAASAPSAQSIRLCRGAEHGCAELERRRAGRL